MVMPYLTFNGNCEQAFLWYEKVFGGKVMHMSKYEDGKVMHGQMMLTENGGISGADSVQPVSEDGCVSIHVHFMDEVKAKEVFKVLSDEGTVYSELVRNPPPDDGGVSGCIKDKYGFTWILSAAT